MTGHKNLNHFMTSQKIALRQLSWSQILSQFNFKIKFRADKKAERPDALSRRFLDIPKLDDNPRLKAREFQLLKNTNIN